MDKKIKELMKVCNVFELKKPDDKQIKYFLDTLFVDIKLKDDYKSHIIDYIQGDLRKLIYFADIYKKNLI